MEWHDHSELLGHHAFLSASQHAWLNYSPEKLRQVYENNQKKQKGTELHAFASQAIKNRVKLARLKKALNLFVNDAIGFNMESELVLYYSPNIFGTADAIRFEDGVVRVHDLKTGDRPVENFGQLDIYSALFCLEYNVDPMKVSFVERLYQGNQFREYEPDSESISKLMEKIVEFDKVINDEIKNERG